MAKITRFTGNMQPFGISATGTKRTVFGDVTQSDTLDDNLNADALVGWEEGTDINGFPPIQYFNAVAFTAMQFLAYYHQMGIAEWDNAQEYHIGSLTNVAGVIYKSLVNDNINFDPTSEPTKWEQIDAGTLGGQDSAFHRARANHTGTQAVSTLSDHNKAAHDAFLVAPAFHVHKNTANQVVSDATITIVTWSTEEFDTNADFASNTFTPSVAGKYLISATIEAFDLASSSPLIIYLYKNGALYKTFASYDVGASNTSASSVSAVVSANGTTDNFDIRIKGTAVISDITVDGTIDKTYFSGSLISVN